MASCAVWFEQQQSVLPTPAWIIDHIQLDIDGSQFVWRTGPFFWAECSRWTSADGGARGRALRCSACSNGASPQTQLQRIYIAGTSRVAQRLLSAADQFHICWPRANFFVRGAGHNCCVLWRPDVLPSVRIFIPFCSVTFLQNLDSKELILLRGLHSVDW